MPRNEVTVHIEDRQITELKKVVNQSDLKKIREIDKLSKQLQEINKKLNLVISGLEILFNNIVIDEEESDG